MVPIIRNSATIIVLGIALTHLSCIDWVNPYDDISKSKIVITENSLRDGDTVIVDSTYSLILAVLLQEYIDSFTITIDKSAPWTDTTVCIDELNENPIRFNVVFHDTGRITIEITALYIDNRQLIQRIHVYGRHIGGPTIAVMSGSVVNDTIIADTIPFTLKVRVQDAYNELDTVYINGDVFDSICKESGYLFYCYATFSAQDFENTPIEARIYAENRIQENITETYWICSTFVDTTITIVRADPPDSVDSVAVYLDSITMSGRIDGITNGSAFYYLFMSVNGYMPDIMNIISKTNNTWQRGARLAGSWNRIVFYLFDTTDTGSTPLDSNVLIVNYVTSDPRIVSLNGRGSVLHEGIITDKNNLTGAVTVRKAGPGIMEFEKR
jgi:hypothetical protein